MSRARNYCVDDIFGCECQDAFVWTRIAFQYCAKSALLLRMIVRARQCVTVSRGKVSLDLELRVEVNAQSMHAN